MSETRLWRVADPGLRFRVDPASVSPNAAPAARMRPGDRTVLCIEDDLGPVEFTLADVRRWATGNLRGVELGARGLLSLVYALAQVVVAVLGPEDGV